MDCPMYRPICPCTRCHSTPGPLPMAIMHLLLPVRPRCTVPLTTRPRILHRTAPVVIRWSIHLDHPLQPA